MGYRLTANKVGMMNKSILIIVIVLGIGIILSVFILTNFKISGQQIQTSATSAVQTPADGATIQDCPQGKHFDSRFDLCTDDLPTDLNIVYAPEIHYLHGELSLVDIELVEGRGPDRYVEPEVGYTAKVISDIGSTLYFFKFEVPTKVFAEPGIIQLDETVFNLFTPYFANGKSIDIYDENDQLKLSIDVSRFAKEISFPRRILVTHFPFDATIDPVTGSLTGDITGNLAQDTSGNNNRGILKDGDLPTTIDAAPLKLADPGKINQALKFDGLDDAVTVSHSDSLDLSTSTGASLSAWIKKSAGGVYEFQTIMAKRPALFGNPRPYSLNFDRENKRIQFALATGKTDSLQKYAAAVSLSEIQAGWTLVTGVWDGTSIKLYINGVLESSTPFSGPIQAGDDPTGASQPKPLSIGSGESLEANFNGEIDDVRIYNYALTDRDVAKLSEQALYVKEFLSVKDQYEGLPANIVGIVKSKYSCPVCTTGMICPAAPCLNNNYITLADYLEDGPENEIIINYISDFNLFTSIQTGNIVSVNAKYSST